MPNIYIFLVVGGGENSLGIVLEILNDVSSFQIKVEFANP